MVARLLAAAALALGASSSVAAAAQVVEQGAAGAVTRCSETAVETTCLLAFGAPFADAGAITSLQLGPLTANDVVVARPSGAGTWEVVELSSSSDRWKPRAGTAIIDTAIPVGAGDRLLIIDPDVSAGGASTEFGPEGDSIAPGASVGLTPVGRVTIEPDLDGDGYGDESQDLCPGVSGAACQPSGLAIAVAVPGYVRGLDVARASWTATNGSARPQALVVNLYAPPNSERSYPPGTVCGPGYVATPADLLIAPAARSPLAPAAPQALTTWPQPVHHSGERAEVAASLWQHCRLPVLGPGATATGTISSPKWRMPAGAGYFDLRATIASPAVDAGGAPAGATAQAQVSHGFEAPMNIDGISAIGQPGRLTFGSNCPGATGYGLQPCRISAQLRSVVGKHRLGSSGAPLPVELSTAQGFSVKLSRSGLRWLARNPRSSVQLVVTLQREGELDVTRTRRFKPTYSKSMRRTLSKLAKPKRRPKSARR